MSHIKKVKVKLKEAMKVHRGSTGIVARERYPVPIVEEARRVPEPVWSGAENLAPHRDSIPVPSSP